MFTKIITQLSLLLIIMFNLGVQVLSIEDAQCVLPNAVEKLSFKESRNIVRIQWMLPNNVPNTQKLSYSINIYNASTNEIVLEKEINEVLFLIIKSLPVPCGKYIVKVTANAECGKSPSAETILFWIPKTDPVTKFTVDRIEKTTALSVFISPVNPMSYGKCLVTYTIVYWKKRSTTNKMSKNIGTIKNDVTISLIYLESLTDYVIVIEATAIRDRNRQTYASKKIMIETDSGTIPEKVNNFTVRIINEKAQLTWNLPSRNQFNPVTEYSVRKDQEIHIISKLSISFPHGECETHEYTVIAKNNNGYSEESSKTVTASLTTALTSPSNVKVRSLPGKKGFAVSYSMDEDLKLCNIKFEVEYKEKNKENTDINWTKLIKLPNTNQEQIITVPNDDIVLQVRLRKVVLSNTEKSSDYSQVFEVTIDKNAAEIITTTTSPLPKITTTTKVPNPHINKSAVIQLIFSHYLLSLTMFVLIAIYA